jgi:hypothetical protein
MDDEDIVLTSDQEAVLERFTQFLMDNDEKVICITGYAGTGKSTLIRILLKRLDGYIKTWQLLTGDVPELDVALTATTNKAAEAFTDATGKSAGTIHSFLKLRLSQDYSTGVKILAPAKGAPVKTGYLLFIDEASMIDPHLLGLIFEMTEDCKIVFMGDPAQLPPVKYPTTPVFNAGFPMSSLTQVVRQAAGSPINALATQFRETVTTGIWKPFEPDGQHIIHLDREAFDQAAMQEFNRPDWHYHDSKVLAYTNARAIAYNNALRDHIKGNPELQVGDYAICNSYIRVGNDKISTDAMVRISEIEDECEVENVRGRFITVDGRIRTFAPYNPADIKRMLKYATDNKKWTLMREIESWIDLRAAYAQTINKSQGSTYDKVFIDLDDVATCTNGNLIARLMYVAVSRARYKVYLTGDFG